MCSDTTVFLLCSVTTVFCYYCVLLLLCSLITLFPYYCVLFLLWSLTAVFSYYCAVTAFTYYRDDAHLGMIMCSLRLLLSKNMYSQPTWKDANGENGTEEGRGKGKDGGGFKGRGGEGNSGLQDIWKAQKLILKGLAEVKQGQTAMSARVQAIEDQLYQSRGGAKGAHPQKCSFQ
jgi:hypothetical protein